MCIKEDQSSTDCDEEVQLPSSQLSYIVTNGLRSGQYFVTVYPQTTEYGLASPTESINVLGPVEDVSCIAGSSSEITCSWTAYVVTDGTLTSYTLCLRTDPSTSTCDVIQGVSSSTTSYTFSGLTSNTVYYPFIFALTSFGFNLENVPTAATTFGSGRLFVCILSCSFVFAGLYLLFVIFSVFSLFVIFLTFVMLIMLFISQFLLHLLEVSMLYIQVLKLQLLGQLLQEDLLEKK